MSITITLPDGRKVRSASQRRYVVVATHMDKPYIARRSDNLAVARHVSQSFRGSVIFDQTERRFTF